MQWAVWLVFIGASIAISVSPGAGAIQSMATGLSYGLRRGHWSITGLEIGLLAQLAAGAVGLGAAAAQLVVTQQTNFNRTFSGFFAAAAVALSLVRRGVTV